MQDEFGRPLSDDGQWVWDGSAWRPTAAQGGPGAAGGALDPTMVAPRDYQPTGGQPAQGDYYQSQYGSPGGYGPGGPGGPNGPGGPKPPVPWYKRQGLMITLIAILLVLSAVLVTVLLKTRGDGKNSAAPPTPTTATPTTASPTTQAPTTPPPTEAPTTPPPTTVPPTSPPPTSVAPGNTVVPGIYDCTSGGSQIGTVNFQGTRYTTDSGASGTYQLDPATGDISFTGGDLGDFTGTYDATGPSMDLSSAAGTDLHCAQ